MGKRCSLSLFCYAVLIAVDPDFAAQIEAGAEKDKASIRKPSSWASLPEALSAFATGRYAGIGAMLTPPFVLVDLDHTTVTAVILSVGGFLGIGDKLVAVPVNQIPMCGHPRC